jgi:hypothetical protein
VPGSLHGLARYAGRPYFWQAWAELLHSVRTGENAFRHVHGEDVWSYRAKRPDESAVFDGAMQARTGTSVGAILAAVDFSRYGTVVDVGGGNGTLLAAVLAVNPGVKGVLFDQPHVVAGAEAVLAAADVADRCRVVAGDFFDSVPSPGDAYLLKWVIHDWEDEEATAILRVVRSATAAHSRLLVVERDLGPPNEAAPAKLSDLNMLVAPGGRERTREEYAALLDAAGFRLDAVTPAGPELAVFEGAPA